MAFYLVFPFGKKTGLQPGGWVVPGYIAFFLSDPWLLVVLVLSSVLTLLYL
ncbi:hypothetical protein AMR47_10210 [Leptospira interrogans]|nr:hypothetical protein AMR47_10210 [Leptospira interrogans]